MSNSFLDSMLSYNKYLLEKEDKERKRDWEREKFEMLQAQRQGDNYTPTDAEIKQGFAGGFFNSMERELPNIVDKIARRRKNNQRVLNYFNAVRQQQDLLGEKMTAESNWLQDMAPAFKQQIMQISGLSADQAKDVIKPFIDSYNQRVGVNATIDDINPSNGNMYITDSDSGSGGVVNLYRMFPDLEVSNVVQNSQNALFSENDMKNAIMRQLQEEQEDKEYKRAKDFATMNRQERALALQEQSLRDRQADREMRRQYLEDDRQYKRYLTSPEYLSQKEYISNLEKNRQKNTEEYKKYTADLEMIKAKKKVIQKMAQIRENMVEKAGGEQKLNSLFTSDTPEAQKLREKVVQPTTTLNPFDMGNLTSMMTGKKSKEALKYGMSATNTLEQVFMKDLRRIYGANPSDADLAMAKKGIPNIFQPKEVFETNLSNLYDELQDDKLNLLKKKKDTKKYSYYDDE